MELRSVAPTGRYGEILTIKLSSGDGLTEGKQTYGAETRKSTASQRDGDPHDTRRTQRISQ